MIKLKDILGASGPLREAQLQDLPIRSLLGLGVKATVSMGDKKLVQLFDALDSWNAENGDKYSEVVSYLSGGIEALQDRYPKAAKRLLKQFNKECVKALKGLKESINEAPSVISMKESEKVWDALVKKFSDNKNDSIEYLNKDRSYRTMAIKAIFTATKF